MNRDTSIYLDCARFLAALTVMFCHIDEDLLRGFFPSVDHLGIEAVGVFFILSGFVIGYATEFKEADLRNYAINRAARLYSVVIPCLTLTLFLDTAGKALFPTVYFANQSFLYEILRIVFSFSFLNYSWLLPHPVSPGSDGPFWSLCFEVPFYALFGAGRFLRGRQRWLALGFLLLLAGPFVLLTMPLWLAGLWTYRLCRRIEPGAPAARAILVLAALLWVGFEALLRHFDLCPNVKADIAAGPLLIYGGGLCFGLSIIGFRFSGFRLGSIAAPAGWLAGATFTLYLLHFPLSCLLNQLLAASPIRAWPVVFRLAILAGVTFGLVLLTAQFTERRKTVWRNAIDRLFRGVETRFGY